ncbi:MAG: FAD-binding protein [Desulfobacterales bacterium]|nr:FAD-binding protein [Desulfobacterales bacterium]
MTTVETTDVVIIGGGLAGMAAADAAPTQGARVLILDRSALGLGTNTALSNGVFAGPTAAYAREVYLADTHRIGKGLGLDWMARRIAADIRSGIEWLQNAGLEIEEKKDHYFVVARGGKLFPGAHLARQVAAYIRSRPGITIRTGTWVKQVVTAGQQAVGVTARNERGRQINVEAGAVVLAAGGAGALYLRNDNQKSALGQGYALALDAGLALWDMEFIQYYPVVMAQAHLPKMMLNSPHPEGSRIINAAGEDLAVKYDIADLNDAIRNRRDWLSAILFEEGKTGEVFMDYRAVANHHWERHPLVLLKERRFNFRTQPVAISPAAHYVMGGVRIDERGKTDIDGLFACGEIVSGVHGACRKGGNALSECLVFGKIAGRHAARRALTGSRGPWPAALQALLKTSQDELPAPSPRKLRSRVQNLAWRCAGVVREANGLSEGLVEIERLARQISGMPLATARDRRLRQDLWSMSRILRTILAASWARRESRGCFLRSDYPDQDDAAWLKNSRVTARAETTDLAIEHVAAAAASAP